MCVTVCARGMCERVCMCVVCLRVCAIFMAQFNELKFFTQMESGLNCPLEVWPTSSVGCSMSVCVRVYVCGVSVRVCAIFVAQFN